MRQGIITNMFRILGIHTKWKDYYILEAYLETFESIAEDDRVDTIRAVKERAEDTRITEEQIAFTKEPLVEDENIVANNTGVNISIDRTNTIHIS